MAAPIGNDYGTKLKAPELRQIAYKDYCAHLAKGKSKRSWVFEHENHSVTWETMEKYIKETQEFDPQQKKSAEAKGFAIWEQVCEDSAKGTDKGKSNTASLQMVMRNKFGWDKLNQAKEEEQYKREEEEKAQVNLLADIKRLQDQSALKMADNSVSNENQS